MTRWRCCGYDRDDVWNQTTYRRASTALWVYWRSFAPHAHALWGRNGSPRWAEQRCLVGGWGMDVVRPAGDGRMSPSSATGRIWFSRLALLCRGLRLMAGRPAHLELFRIARPHAAAVSFLGRCGVSGLHAVLCCRGD